MWHSRAAVRWLCVCWTREEWKILPQWDNQGETELTVHSSPYSPAQTQSLLLRIGFNWELKSGTTSQSEHHLGAASSGHLSRELPFLDPVAWTESGIRLKLTEEWCILARSAKTRCSLLLSPGRRNTLAAKERANRDKRAVSQAACSVVLWMVKHEGKHCTINWPNYGQSLALPCRNGELCRSAARWTPSPK